MTFAEEAQAFRQVWREFWTAVWRQLPWGNRRHGMRRQPYSGGLRPGGVRRRTTGRRWGETGYDRSASW